MPIFITMRDSDTLGKDGFPIQEYTINVGKPLLPDVGLSRGERILDLMKQNECVWREIYTNFYGAEPIYPKVEAK